MEAIQQFSGDSGGFRLSFPFGATRRQHPGGISRGEKLGSDPVQPHGLRAEPKFKLFGGEGLAQLPLGRFPAPMLLFLCFFSRSEPLMHEDGYVFFSSTGKIAQTPERLHPAQI